MTRPRTRRLEDGPGTRRMRAPATPRRGSGSVSPPPPRRCVDRRRSCAARRIQRHPPRLRRLQSPGTPAMQGIRRPPSRRSPLAPPPPNPRTSICLLAARPPPSTTAASHVAPPRIRPGDRGGPPPALASRVLRRPTDFGEARRWLLAAELDRGRSEQAGTGLCPSPFGGEPSARTTKPPDREGEHHPV